MKSLSIKTQLIIFLSIFAGYISIIHKDIAFLSTTLIAVISAVFLDSFITYLKTEHFAITDSSVISGLIIGYVISSGEPWWKFLFASIFAIGSKHLIRIKNKQLFNPAAFGVFLSTLLLGASTQWKGTYLWYIIVLVGFYFVYKIKKIEIIIGYAIIFFLFFGTQAVLQKVPFVNIFGYLSYFYIFVMLIEPKTTPIKATAKFIFGSGVAALIFILTEAGLKYDVELLSLLIMNGTVPLLNKLPYRQGG